VKPVTPNHRSTGRPGLALLGEAFPRSLRWLGAVRASAGHHVEVSWLKSRSVFSFKAEYQTRSTSLHEDRNP
jgi:hypothetical protein